MMGPPFIFVFLRIGGFVIRRIKNPDLQSVNNLVRECYRDYKSL